MIGLLIIVLIGVLSGNEGICFICYYQLCVMKTYCMKAKEKIGDTCNFRQHSGGL